MKQAYFLFLALCGRRTGTDKSGAWKRNEKKQDINCGR
jgi:hypothetical protein